MAIKKSQNGHWGHFPYAPNYTEDRTNNGGIDLTKEAHRIDEIHELEGLPRIKKAMTLLNSSENPFMTTGFLHDRKDENSLYLGYLEFCFRPDVDFTQVDFQNLDELFLEYILEKMGQQFVAFYQTEFLWNMHVGTLHEYPPAPVFSIYYRSRYHQETEEILLPVFSWLQTDFQYSDS
jgi:hypothetical protein